MHLIQNVYLIGVIKFKANLCFVFLLAFQSFHYQPLAALYQCSTTFPVFGQISGCELEKQEFLRLND
jgi:hypothetical protein